MGRSSLLILHVASGCADIGYNTVAIYVFRCSQCDGYNSCCLLDWDTVCWGRFVLRFQRRMEAAGCVRLWNCSVFYLWRQYSTDFFPWRLLLSSSAEVPSRTNSILSPWPDTACRRDANVETRGGKHFFVTEMSLLQLIMTLIMTFIDNSLLKDADITR
jgi:hypothetical protein